MELKDYVVIRKSEHGEVSLGLNDDGEQFVRKSGAFDKDTVMRIARIDSPYIVGIIEICDNEIYMEYIDGESLSERKVKPEELYTVFTELCSAVSALHKAGVIHRDIKPSNIMLTKEGHLKLIDFDAARIKKEAKDKDTCFIGTEGFAPPEQYGFNQTDQRSDIYAVGATMKQILGENYNKSPYRSIAEKCMRFSPEQRYPSVDKLLSALYFRRNSWKYIAVSSVLIIAAALTACFCLFAAGKDGDIEPASTSTAISTIGSAESPVKEATSGAVSSAASNTQPQVSEPDITETDQAAFVWDILPITDSLPRLYDFVSKYEYEYGCFDFYWEEIADDDISEIKNKLKSWLGDCSELENSYGDYDETLYNNSACSVCIDLYGNPDRYGGYKLFVRITPQAYYVAPAAEMPLKYSISDSNRGVEWSEISGLPEGFPTAAENVTFFENKAGNQVKIQWDKMSAAEFTNIAWKIADYMKLPDYFTSVSLSDDAILYEFNGTDFSVALFRNTNTGNLNPNQVSLQIY
ncbi:MAG: serine/threonine-protein kinase [Ruminiclostridium sp.]